MDREGAQLKIIIARLSSFPLMCKLYFFVLCAYYIFGTRDLFNISYSRELYLFSKFLHFEEIVRVKIAVHFKIIVIEACTTF